MEQKIYKKFVKDFSKNLIEMKKEKEFTNIIIFCVGTDKILGDSLGPLVGYQLGKKLKNNKAVKVIGDLQNIISAKNIDENLSLIGQQCQDSCMIVVDAALSYNKNVGNILVDKSKVKLGSGIYKNIGEIGDIGIKAVVATNENNASNNYINLKSTKLETVIKLADTISEGICDVLTVGV